MFSLVYVIDEAKERIKKGVEMRENQIHLSKLTADILDAAKGKKMILQYEMMKKEY